MSTLYYGVCQDRKIFIDLDKFYAWATYREQADHSTIQLTDLNDYKEDGWIYRALRLHIFIESHNGHRLGVYTEHEFDCHDNSFSEQYKWPIPLQKLTEQIDMSPSLDRIIINTHLGEVFIDNRGKDINCFRFINGKRIDIELFSQTPEKPPFQQPEEEETLYVTPQKK